MTLAAIGLGSNLGDPVAKVREAFAALERVGTVVKRSSLYRTPAWGVTAQPDFVNAAALVETELRPRELLHALKALESELGRRASFRWGPRAIDLDILTYGAAEIREPDLIVPHERLHERAFALVPLGEIDEAFRPAVAALPAAARAAVQRIPATTARRFALVDWDQTLGRVRSAAEFCASAGLLRFRIDEDDFAVDVLRRHRAPVDVAPPAVPEPDDAAHPVSSNGTASHERAAVLRAEFVGIVRLSRPSVVLGSVVVEDRELAYVESLGIRNPVRSGGAGRIAEVFVTDGEAVEYGQPLFSIEH